MEQMASFTNSIKVLCGTDAEIEQLLYMYVIIGKLPKN